MARYVEIITVQIRHYLTTSTPMERNYQKQLWTELSDQARAVAKTTRDPDLQLQMLLVAARYLVWAKRSEKTGSPLHAQKKPD